MPNDLVGHCSIAVPGEYSKEFLQMMEAPRKVCRDRVYSGGVHHVRSQPMSERVSQLVEELGLENNRLLNNHTEVKSKLIELVAKYHEVFTNASTKVGKTDKLSMKIVLRDDSVPTRAHVRRVKLSFRNL